MFCGRESWHQFPAVHVGAWSARIASVVPAVIPFPVNSQQLVPVFGRTKAPGVALSGFQQNPVTNLCPQSCRVPKPGCIFPPPSWHQEQLLCLAGAAGGGAGLWTGWLGLNEQPRDAAPLWHGALPCLSAPEGAVIGHHSQAGLHQGIWPLGWVLQPAVSLVLGRFC